MPKRTWSALIFVVVAAWSCGRVEGSGSGVQGLPLHWRIDQIVEAAAVGPLAANCSDADFVRRVYLDLTGVIPTAEQARSFLADESPDKRRRLIDELLASADFVRHMTITLDVMLMERRAEKTVKQTEWESYLVRSLAEDKPLDQLCRELIACDGADEALRPAARFLLDRDAEPNLVTRDIGRIFFGMDFQCCQCHDHPLIDDYYQEDYYGLFAFVHRTSLFTDPKSKLVQLGEKADGEAGFKSVFTGEGTDRAMPRLPKGAVLFVEPVFPKDQEYVIKPDKEARGVPKYSRRKALAEHLADSRELKRNLANRLWAAIFGRGLVQPVDFHYSGNPPTHPELLSLLADELAAGGFQLRPFVRELVLSRTYQRSCEAPRPETINYADIAARLERLVREREAQLAALSPLREALSQAKAAFQSAREQEMKIAAELPRLEQAAAQAREALAKTEDALKAAEAALVRFQAQARAVSDLAQVASETVAKVAGDKAIAEAADRIAARSRELAGAVQVAERAVAEQRARRDRAAGSLAAAEAKLADLASARPGIEKLRSLERKALAAEHAVTEARYRIAAADRQIAAAKAIVEYPELARLDPAKAESAWAAIVERWTIAGQIAPLKPLSPEQFGASGMQATGMLAPQIAAIEAKLDKSPPAALKHAAEADRARIQAQLCQTELLAQLRTACSEFVRQYGGLPGQDFQATVNQALFLGNGGVIDGWLKPAGENLASRLSKLEDVSALSDEMYFAVLSRPATDSERQSVAAFLKGRESDRPAAIGEMVWGLLSSTEFRFNH